MQQARSDEERPVLKKFLYRDGNGFRVLRGFDAGESDDHLFFVIKRPLGDTVLIAKAAVVTITPAREPGARP